MTPRGATPRRAERPPSARAPLVVIAFDAAAVDGPPDASDTLAEAAAIAAALEADGYSVERLPVSLDLAGFERELAKLRPAVVFNLVESLAGRGRLLHLVPALLETLGVPFTGCSSDALARTSNKLAAKAAMAAAGLRVPAALTAHEAGETVHAAGGAAGTSDEAEAADSGDRWIVKSVFEHASFGLDDGAVVRGAAAARSTLAARAATHGGAWLAEAFLPGRELNVALLGVPADAVGAVGAAPLVLPVAEIAYRGFPRGKPEIVGYAAKWHSDSFEYRNTERTFDVAPELAARAAALARRCWQLFGLSGYARVDLRGDARGELHVLEVNANPCLAPDAGYAAALARAEIDYARAVGALVAEAIERGAPK